MSQKPSHMPYQITDRIIYGRSGWVRLCYIMTLQYWTSLWLEIYSLLWLFHFMHLKISTLAAISIAKHASLWGVTLDQILNIFLSLTSWSPKWSLPMRSSSKMLYPFLVSILMLHAPRLHHNEMRPLCDNCNMHEDSKFFGVWCNVVGWMVPNISKESKALIPKGQVDQEEVPK